MNHSARFDFPKIPLNQTFTLRLMISAAGEAPDRPRKQPLNLAVVLDRSGSMEGHKLENVKRATRSLVQQLGAEERFSLTVFDDLIDVLVRPGPLRDTARHAERAIDGIQTRGCTNLFGGYETGCRLAGEFHAKGVLSRVLLLTDGLANRGETSPSAIARFASQQLEHGVKTTTIGVGDGYNEELLALMAQAGGGGTYFMETPDEATSIFQEELGELRGLAGTDFKIRFVFSMPGVAWQPLNQYKTLSSNEYYIGDVYGGRTRSLLLELKLPAVTVAGPVEIGHAEVSYTDFTEGEGVERHGTIPLALEAVPYEEFARQVPDREVMLEAALLTVARVKAEALELANRREFERAAAKMEICADQMEQLGLGSDALNFEIAELRRRAAETRNRRERFWDATERKRAYTEMALMRASEPAKLRRMYQRREM